MSSPMNCNEWLVEGHRILAQVVPLRNTYIQIGLEKNEFRTIRSEELYGILRSIDVQEIHLTETEPIHIVIHFRSSYPEYFKISFSDYVRFQRHYKSIYKT